MEVCLSKVTEPSYSEIIEYLNINLQPIYWREQKFLAITHKASKYLEFLGKRQVLWSSPEEIENEAAKAILTECLIWPTTIVGLTELQVEIILKANRIVKAQTDLLNKKLDTQLAYDQTIGDCFAQIFSFMLWKLDF